MHPFFSIMWSYLLSCLFSCYIGNVESDSVNKYVEKFVVTASYDGLVLVENNHQINTTNATHNIENSSGGGGNRKGVTFGTASTSEGYEYQDQQNNNNSSYNNSSGNGRYMEDDSDRLSEHVVPLMEMEIEVFQNQRRHFMYPFDWSSKVRSEAVFV